MKEREKRREKKEWGKERKHRYTRAIRENRTKYEKKRKNRGATAWKEGRRAAMVRKGDDGKSKQAKKETFQIREMRGRAFEIAP